MQTTIHFYCLEYKFKSNEILPSLLTCKLTCVRVCVNVNENTPLNADNKLYFM